MNRFRLSSGLFLLAVICIALGWYVDRSSLARKLEANQHPITSYWEKHAYWSPSLHLNMDTDTLESNLADHVDAFSGELVESSQGMSQATLRQASPKTMDDIALLLDCTDQATRLAAARLSALYLEAVSGRSNTNQSSIEKRAYFQANFKDKIMALLQDNDPDLRAAAALIVGNLYFTREIEQVMMDAFDREDEQTVKLYLAWAHHHIAD